MKFFLVLAFTVVFFSAFTRADDDNEEDEDDDDEEPQAFSSALQLNGNNVGDINNIKGTIKISFSNKRLRKSRWHFAVVWDGELHNEVSVDIISILLALLNKQTGIEAQADDDEDDE